MSTNSTDEKWECPIPFLPEALYPSGGGSRAGRLCAPAFGASCCLSCPRQDWFYPSHFQTLIDVATYFNLVSVAGCVFLLASFWVLPVTSTHRHYLSVCLVVSVLIMELAFVIPFGNTSREHQCINDITPYDQASSVVCALSGAALLAGGWSVVLWVFLRALSLHLQICWQVIPGRQFFIGAMTAGWAIAAAMVAVALSVTGVSFRFGNTCHINSKNGLASFWGPLLAFAAAAIVTQFVTFGYCIQVYLRSLFEDRQTTEMSIPYPTSVLSASYTQALRRIRHVISLQWRGILVVIIIIADVVFFATVFLQFEGTSETTPEMLHIAQPWLTCIVLHKGDKEKCYEFAKPLVVPEVTAVTVLFLLSCNGIWVLVLLGRWSMFTGWAGWFRGLFKRKDTDEFVSIGAAQQGQFGIAPGTYTDLPSNTYDMSERKFRDDIAVESYELTNPTIKMSSHPSVPPPIIRRESFKPQRKRGLSIRFSLSPLSPTTISTPVREEAVAELGYNYPLSDSGSKGAPRGANSNKSSNMYPHALQKTRSQRTMPSATEITALQMSVASANSRTRMTPSPVPSSKYSSDMV